VDVLPVEDEPVGLALDVPVTGVPPSPVPPVPPVPPLPVGVGVGDVPVGVGVGDVVVGVGVGVTDTLGLADGLGVGVAEAEQVGLGVADAVAEAAESAASAAFLSASRLAQSTVSDGGQSAEADALAEAAALDLVTPGTGATP
jgi:hypothetical protein